MLKSLIAQRSGELPPRIHQLVRLAEAAGLPITLVRADFLRELSSYYIQTRYPGETADLASQVSADDAQAILRQTEEMVEWLSSTPG